MRLTLVFMRTLLKLPYTLRRLTRTGAFGENGAVALDAPPGAGGNPLKAALWRHHVKQYNAASCSVATVVSVVNAARAVQGLGGPPIGQLEILDAVPAADWKARMRPEGHNGRRGLPLPLLGEVVTRSLLAYGISCKKVETVPALRRPPGAAAVKAVLRRRLSEFDAQGRGLIIAHFDQGAFVPELNIPHISPVGAYDAASGQVTVLDVDPDQPHPYRVAFDTFYEGLSSDYHHVFRPFGYRSGGYVWVRLTD